MLLADVARRVILVVLFDNRTTLGLVRLKMRQTATKLDLSPRALADKNSARFREMVATLGLSNDDFIRTTEPRHRRAVLELLQRCYDAGDIELDAYSHGRTAAPRSPSAQ